MKIVVGIDIGGSTTKICGFKSDKTLISMLSVKSSDPVASVYGAFGKFTAEAGVSISDVEKVMVTGVGSRYIKTDIYGIKTEHISEFECIGLGGLYLANLQKALVISMGTGTAIVYSDEKGSSYLGGTGIGGGTILGLSKEMIDVTDIKNIAKLAESGNLSNINLLISDITPEKYSSTLTPDITAANFGKISDLTTREDVAVGILNLVFETIGMMGVFAAQSRNTKDIVLIGHLSELLYAKKTLGVIGKMFDLNFIVPEKSQYGTVMGAALSYFKKNT